MKNFIKRVSDWFNRYLNVLKALFLIVMIVFVIYEGHNILQEINGRQMQASLASQSPLHLLILTVLGLLAVTPMLTYDFTIVEFLPGKFKPGYIIKSGWITNSFTNIAGFGGFLGASLRASFYSKNATKKQVLYAISKIALFLLAGLSTYCIVSLVMIYGFGVGQQDHRYWPFLLGGGIYFPVIFLFTRFNNSEFFADLTIKREIKLIIGSCLEWGSCGLFFIIIGMFMNLHIDFVSVFPLFIAANVIGVISMLPGGLGTFDLTMITGLGFMGVSPTTATVWVLLYRVFYYFIPFGIGVVLFAQELLKRFNRFLDDIPANIVQRSSQIIVTCFMYFSGIMMILLATVPNVVLVNPLYFSLAPFSLYFLGQLSNVIVGCLLIGLARGVGARVQKAFWPTVILLVFAIANTLWKEDFPLPLAIFLIFILICLWLARKGLYRERLTYSWGALITDAGLFIATFGLYVLVGFVLGNHRHLQLTNAYLLPSQQTWVIGLIGFIIAICILYGLYRYLTYANLAWYDLPFDGERIKKLINQYSGNEVSHLVFLRDKKVYFYTEDGEDQIAFMYKQKANKLIIMGEPFGNQEKLEAAIDQFMIDVDNADLTLVFYEVSESLTMMLHDKGFDFIKAGEEGQVDLNQFTLVGKRHRGERALMHKFERDGYHFEILQPPFSDKLLSELKEISDEWLHGREEKGFSLGFFDPYYLNQAPIAVFRNEDQQIVAFANIMPTGDHKMTSIDLMRSSSKAPSGVMDGIFINLFQYSKDEGYQCFNLGMAPLANVGNSRFSFINEKIAHLIYEYGDSFYSFQGLRSYKQKYVDKWESKYFVYRKNNSLVFTMLQLLAVVNERPKQQ
ncbi:bifunctional lysylphosphatidylglycerol flippase/synthetase MprF [Fructilactobacillus carniphilus]|uniref:Phosphatidylglycerol lysyltransferase n=1 Tax=Fructilactobacillus carniphilus TaxID=2940297 RepID=A0ABY5BWT5_9LACO|nr:bifunctional lysylphosphatidylglycerol flippase/synthetase MprF [Fructilactobacillus carniphilus]USS90103.1 bifunctional lysylphosphatidylglycerol flippase/synthetase MprF [Fructilactobacillus carniphilus]